ncbi:MAG: hypothetical protein JRI96_10830, partial [Deltaproteobacteria bacterium]|nr:hypothetical protein [Deltaproteobacteria bacterium]
IPEGELAGEDIQWLAQKLSYYIRYFLSWPAWLKVFIIFMTGAAILKIINFHEERAKDRMEVLVPDIAGLRKHIQEKEEEESEQAKIDAMHDLPAVGAIAEFEAEAEKDGAFAGSVVSEKDMKKLKKALEELLKLKKSSHRRIRKKADSYAEGILEFLILEFSKMTWIEKEYARGWVELLDRYSKISVHKQAAERLSVIIFSILKGEPVALRQDEVVEQGEGEAQQDEQAEASEEIPEILSLDIKKIKEIKEKAEREAWEFSRRIDEGRPLQQLECSLQFVFAPFLEKEGLKTIAHENLSIFLHYEVLALRNDFNMLPARIWEHILYLLGATGDEQLKERMTKEPFAELEMIILIWALVQSVGARKNPNKLRKIYGLGFLQKEESRQTLEHLSKIKANAASHLRHSHKALPEQFDKTVELFTRMWKLNEAQADKVRQLIRKCTFSGKPQVSENDLHRKGGFLRLPEWRRPGRNRSGKGAAENIKRRNPGKKRL